MSTPQGSHRGETRNTKEGVTPKKKKGRTRALHEEAQEKQHAREESKKNTQHTRAREQKAGENRKESENTKKDDARAQSR